MDGLIDALIAISTAAVLVYWRDSIFKSFLPKKPQISLTDESIQKPLVATVFSSKFICLAIPSITFILILLQQMVSILFIEKATISLEKLEMKLLICFITGYSATLLSVLMIKNLVGRPRPSFLAMNGIQVDKSTGLVTVKGYKINGLASSSEAIEQVAYFLSKIKNDHDSSVIWKADSLRSFYSGHSCVPMYCAIFCLLHLHSIMAAHNVPVTSWQVIIETVYFVLSLYPGISQALTFHHNWSDVVTGHLIGSSTAVIAFFFFV